MSDDSNAGPGSAIALVETKLLELFGEILGVLNVKVHDNFLDPGGHSLLGIRVINRIRDEFGGDLELYDRFDAPTVALLSPYVAAAIATETAS